jgi:hypothetical protein
MQVRLFLERHARAIAILLTLLASVRIVSTYTVFNHTFDEPIHLACGMEWLDKGTYTCEPQHPPLARAAAALGPYLTGIRSQGVATRDIHSQPLEGLAILYSGGHYDRTLAAARFGILPFFWIACAVVYLWAKRYGGALTALVAVLLFTSLPAVLAHAGLATTDMALTAFLGAAFLAGLIWVESPTYRRAAVFGLLTGLAVLSKFTALVLLPAAAAVVFVVYWATEQPKLGEASRERLWSFVLAVCVGALVIWAGYRFSFGPAGPGGTPLPAPALYAGIQDVLKHNEAGHWSYLLGRRDPSGFWYYYPVALALKTPLAFLALLAFGVFLVFRKGEGPKHLWVPLAFSAAILQAAMMGHINIGIRHILPVYLGFAILAAAGAVKLLDSARFRTPATVILGALLAWHVVSSARCHPDYIAYFNELGGSHPENLLVDSDLDWGQDIKRLSKRLRELGASEVSFPQFIYADLEGHHGFPRVIGKPDLVNPPQQGYFAAGATYWKALRFGLVLTDPEQPIWPDRIEPTERIGRGMFLWVFPPGPRR